MHSPVIFLYQFHTTGQLDTSKRPGLCFPHKCALIGQSAGEWRQL